MADWALPVLTTLYTAVLDILKDRDFDAGSLFVNAPTSPMAGMIRYVRASNKFQEYDGATWNDKLISIAGGGTGAATAAAARTNLGLGTIALQDSNNVTITGGSITGVVLNAPSLTGLVPTASLGSGAANSGTWLRGDQSWQPIPAGTPTGIVEMYAGAAAPATYLLCDGAAVSRTTYAALFAVIGIAYGAGDLSTTFNLPDFRQRFPLGKAASGTGSVLGATGGLIDHTHTSPAHTHTISSDGGHTHTGPSHTHTFSIAAGGSHGHGWNGGTTAAAGSHNHGGNTGGPSNAIGVQSGLGANTNDTAHSHSISTDGSHSHGPGSLDIAQSTHTHSGTTDAAGTGATSSDGAHTHTGATGSTAPADTGTNNPPYQTINFIIKT